MSTSMRNDSICSKKREEDENYKPYCNTPEIHSGSLTLAKKKSSKSANVSDTLSPIDKALSVNIHIKRRTTVTQISLKNFAWNIAFQYNISRDVTAQFVMQTFHEWFDNSTLDTIRKNLRTTTGNHKIKIDEQIIKHPIISN